MWRMPATLPAAVPSGLLLYGEPGLGKTLMANCFIAEAGCKQDAAYLASLLNRNHPPKEILTVEYEPVTGSHVGPDTLALFFPGGDDVRSK